MKKPLIGLTARCEYFETNRKLYANDSYFQFIKESGGIPVLIGTVNEEEANSLALQLDGLVITGGEDIDPKYYEAENTYSELTDADIDESDYLLYQAFRQLNKPILGICRGFQVINVFEHGTLIQDIQKEKPQCHEHNQRKMEPPLGIHDFAHLCHFMEGTILGSLFGESYMVNTYHHQAIKDLSPNLRISVISDDGLIEGFEKENVIAVQWHPERLIHDVKHLGLGKYFISQCISSQQSK